MLDFIELEEVPLDQPDVFRLVDAKDHVGFAISNSGKVCDAKITRSPVIPSFLAVGGATGVVFKRPKALSRRNKTVVDVTLKKFAGLIPNA